MRIYILKSLFVVFLFSLITNLNHFGVSIDSLI